MFSPCTNGTKSRCRLSNFLYLKKILIECKEKKESCRKVASKIGKDNNPTDIKKLCRKRNERINERTNIREKQETSNRIYERYISGKTDWFECEKM